MNYNKKILFAVLLMTTTVFSSMIGYVQGVRGKKSETRTFYNFTPVALQKEKTHTVSGKEEKAMEKKPEAPTPCYVLKEAGGVLALYAVNGQDEKLWQTYDVRVNLLPEKDRAQLADGIEFSSISEALQMIEDFSG